jgi:glutamyl-tRNA(Gln) amidotransferase subunit E
METFVQKEIERQLMLIEVAGELQKRRSGAVPTEGEDLTSLFTSSRSKVVQSALKEGGKVYGWPLPRFAGLLKGKLGPELAAHARVAGVGGIFHSDELPAYGVTQAEVEAVRGALQLGDRDAFVLVADEEAKCLHAIEEMLPRARYAVQGVPEETRDPRPDGTSVYSRPLPGKARMYPETDVPPLRVHEDRLLRIREHLPEPPEAKISRLAKEYGVHEQQARQLVQEGSEDLFELIALEFGESTLVATVLLYHYSELRREGLDVDGIPEDHLRELFSLLKAGRFAKEAIPDLLRQMAVTRGRASDALRTVGVVGLSRAEVERIVGEMLDASTDLLRSRGEGAEKGIMGRVMEKVRGRADGKMVSEIVHTLLIKRVQEEKKGKN